MTCACGGDPRMREHTPELCSILTTDEVNEAIRCLEEEGSVSITFHVEREVNNK